MPLIDHPPCVWGILQALPTETHFAKISGIAFSPVVPHDMAVAASTRIEIYDGNTQARKKTISRLRDIGYSPNYRGDGRLIVAGEESGVIKVRPSIPHTTFDSLCFSLLSSCDGILIPFSSLL